MDADPPTLVHSDAVRPSTMKVYLRKDDSGSALQIRGIALLNKLHKILAAYLLTILKRCSNLKVQSPETHQERARRSPPLLNIMLIRRQFIGSTQRLIGLEPLPISTSAGSSLAIMGFENGQGPRLEGE
ncbi:hypothetical protein EVAR_101152_1 [Eumeta japonica]|uniref:Uncharacterized protein n=1 Tax=Eumeta variegata TaxID=151549 RepID=A0A4C2AFU9_EUMVA|nr:hypothetical protein EVAR_101152_1 [Eumeta japonica]